MKNTSAVFQQSYWNFHINQVNKKLVIPTIFLSQQQAQKVIQFFHQEQFKHQDLSSQHQQSEVGKVNKKNQQSSQNILKITHAFQDNNLQHKIFKEQSSKIYSKQCQQILNDKLKRFQQGTYVKIGEKSAKDLWKGQHNIMMLNIKNWGNFYSLIQYSDYLAEHIEFNCQKQSPIKMGISIRKYLKQLQRQESQYCVYIKQGTVVGICQKYPHHIQKYQSEEQRVKKSQKIEQVVYEILQILEESLEKEDKGDELMDLVIQLYHNEATTKILGIHAYYVSPISLFTDSQLSQHMISYRKQANWQPIFKTVTQKSQLKQEDLSGFTADKQFISQNSHENIQQWMQFMKSAKF